MHHIRFPPQDFWSQWNPNEWAFWEGKGNWTPDGYRSGKGRGHFWAPTAGCSSEQGYDGVAPMHGSSTQAKAEHEGQNERLHTDEDEGENERTCVKAEDDGKNKQMGIKAEDGQKARSRSRSRSRGSSGNDVDNETQLPS